MCLIAKQNFMKKEIKPQSKLSFRIQNHEFVSVNILIKLNQNNIIQFLDDI